MEIIRITSGNLPPGMQRLAALREPIRWRKQRLARVPWGIAVCAMPTKRECVLVLRADADSRGWPVAGYGCCVVPDAPMPVAGDEWLKERL